MVYIVCLRYSIHLTYRVSIEKNANSREHGLLAQLWLDNLKWIAERFQGSQPPNAAHNQWKSDFFYLEVQNPQVHKHSSHPANIRIYNYIYTNHGCYYVICYGIGIVLVVVISRHLSSGPWPDRPTFSEPEQNIRPMFTAHLYPLFHVCKFITIESCV